MLEWTWTFFLLFFGFVNKNKYKVCDTRATAASFSSTTGRPPLEGATIQVSFKLISFLLSAATEARSCFMPCKKVHFCYFATQRECFGLADLSSSSTENLTLQICSCGSRKNVAGRKSVCCKSNWLRTNSVSLSNWLFLGHGSAMCCWVSVVNVTTKPQTDPDWAIAGKSIDYRSTMLRMSACALYI